MKQSKVWVIMGAKYGLGAAAVKYLISKGQVVIALMINDNTPHFFFDHHPQNLYVINIAGGVTVSSAFENAIAQHGQIDYIINNSNYQLFHTAECKNFTEIQDDATKSIAGTITLIKSLLPYLRKDPKGSLINLPPQLCLATLPDNADAVVLSLSMKFFLTGLQEELRAFNCPLTFLEPGERQAILMD